MRTLYIIRSEHLAPHTSSADPLYERVMKKSKIIEDIVGNLIVEKRIDHVFGDNVGPKEAKARNLVLTNNQIYSRWMKCGVNSENDKEHARRIRQLRELRKSTGLDIKFYQTEAEDIDAKNLTAKQIIEPIKNAMFSLTQLPPGLLAKAWYQQFRRDQIDCAVEMMVYLRDKKTAPLITENAGDTNLAEFGSMHKLAGLYDKNSNLRVVGINIEDNGFTLDSNYSTISKDIEEIVASYAGKKLANSI